MRSLINFVVLIATRGLSLGCFFFLPNVTVDETFQHYVIYFSVWQITSQIVAMQLGATMFRLGGERQYDGIFAKLQSCFIKLALLNGVAFFALVFNESHIAPAILMGVNFAIFSVLGDYCRSRINETKAFSYLMLPGLLLMLIYTLAVFNHAHFNFEQLAIVEFSLHFGVILVLYWKYVPRAPKAMRLRDALTGVAGPWRQISLPNWPSILIWYTYFNAPQILGYFIASQIKEYNRQAIVFRIIVAFSTLSAMLVIASQKRLVALYESNPQKYFLEKRNFVCKVLPISFCALLLLVLVTSVFDGTAHVQLPMVLAVVWSFKIHLAILLWLLLSVYYIANFYLAEKNMQVIIPSMLAGFFMYVVSLAAALALGVTGAPLFIVPLSLSIATTLAIRIMRLGRHDGGFGQITASDGSESSHLSRTQGNTP